MVCFALQGEKMKKICVVGLGYFGLPLAVHFSRVFDPYLEGV